MSLNNEAGAMLQRGLILRKSLPATRTRSFKTKPYLCSSVGVRVYVMIDCVFERRFSSDFLVVFL